MSDNRPNIHAHCGKCNKTTLQWVMGSADWPMVRPQTQCQRCDAIWAYDDPDDRATLLEALSKVEEER